MPVVLPFRAAIPPLIPALLTLMDATAAGAGQGAPDRDRQRQVRSRELTRACCAMSRPDRTGANLLAVAGCVACRGASGSGPTWGSS
eukprot:1071557-Rhodomonas_salina.3